MIPTCIPTSAVQKVVFPLAGMITFDDIASLNGMANLLSIVKVFGVSKCGKNLIKPDTKAASNGVSRQVCWACEDLSDVTTRGRQGFSNITTRAEELPRQNRVSRLPSGLYATVRAREACLPVAITSLNECRLNVITVPNEPHLTVISSSNEGFCGVITRAKELTISKMASLLIGGIFGEVSTCAEGFSDITTRAAEDFITVTTRGKTNPIQRQFDNSGKKQAQRYFGTSTHKAEIEFCQSIKRDCSGFIEQYARAREGSCQIDQEPHIVKSYGYHVINQVLGSGQPEFLESIKKECAGRLESAKKNLPLFRFTVYVNSALAKSGAGIGVPECLSATHDAPSVFFCVVRIAQPFFGSTVIIRAAYQVMVGCSGAEKSAPVSDNAGYANPVQSITSEIGVSGGGINTQLSEAAIWLLPPPKNRLLSGDSILASNHAISLLLLALNPKPDLCCPIAHACLLPASVQEALMLKSYDVPANPVIYTKHLIALAQLTGDVLTNDSAPDTDFLLALAFSIETVARDLHCMLESNELPEVKA